ncbi:hypothetical protein HOO65_030209 [Ceratocystis lukuohia]|uniref:Uncharacterized protein n=4 Tax=Ceratocystis TaxID=5157 RepID=A0A0F8B2Q1_CERFI|nr:hypothetical protein CFO_g3448 [Ceratocystis platani]PHH53161.1 hypothetical protein CFIMG_008280RA00001 [Ceratocystis fimbriata CBS 114723]
MCQYYAHQFVCKHKSLSFARYCERAGLIQTPCQDRSIWQTIGMDNACEECIMYFPDKFPRRRMGRI